MLQIRLQSIFIIGSPALEPDIIPACHTHIYVVRMQEHPKFTDIKFLFD